MQASLSGFFSALGAELSMAIQMPLIYNALIVGTLVSLCAAVLGVILVLKHYALIGHGLGEVGFAALALAMLMGMSDNSLLIAIPVVCAAAIVIMKVSRDSGMGGDVLIGIFSTSALAIGVILSSFNTGYIRDVCNYMFGSLYGMNALDVYLSVALSAVVLIVFVLLFNRLFAVTYDETNARAIGMNADFYQFVISLLTAITVVLGMRMMGAMLISSFIIFPAMTARRMVKSFRAMILCAAAVSLFSFLTGMFLSYSIEMIVEYFSGQYVRVNLPTGASVVGVSLIVMLITYAVTAIKTRR